MQKKLIVPLNYGKLKYSSLVVFFMSFVLSALFFILHSSTTAIKFPFWLYSVLFAIKGLLLLLIGIFLTSGLWILTLKDNETAAILDKEGIWIKEFGFIEWDYISKIETYRYRDNVLLESIAVHVDKNFKLGKQAAWSGKMRIFWSKLFGYPAILISFITIPNHEVIEFAQQFIK